MSDLPLRSACKCDCHTSYAMHCLPCCRPDPIPARDAAQGTPVTETPSDDGGLRRDNHHAASDATNSARRP
jgi:hypothetical protein